jgi:hypothetical protein
VDRNRLDTLHLHGVSFDVETHLTQPGLKAPPLVLGSAAKYKVDDAKVRGTLLDKPTTRATFEKLLANPRAVIVGANIAYDMLVLAVDAAKRGIDLMPQIFAAYEQGRVFDIQIAEMLNAIADGTLGKDPRTGRPMTDPITGKQGRYSLSICTDIVLGRANAKVNDLYRERYAEFDDVPLDQLPLEARVYPVDDAINTLEVALAQVGFIERPGVHTWPSGGVGSDDHCPHCGCNAYESHNPCVPRKRRHRNLHDLANQCYTHFAMHLGAAWGFMVDQAKVDAIEADVLKNRDEDAKPFFDLGWFQWKKEKGVIKQAAKQAPIKRAVALAYGASGTCEHCDGIGKVPSAGATRRACGKTCGMNGGGKDGRYKHPKTGVCILCDNTGERWTKVKGCKPCDSTGLDLDSAVVPRTEGGKCKDCNETGYVDGEECELCEGAGIIQGVGMGRDDLYESGNEMLLNLAAFGEKKKIVETYVPALRAGRKAVTFVEKCEETGAEIERIIYKNIPWTLSPNVLLETGRTSYNGVIQLLPRKGGVRECLVARPRKVLCSVDYEAGELVTHAQNTTWIVGFSRLAEALNNQVKVHNAFAATVLGMAYDLYQDVFVNGEPGQKKTMKDVRQAAKPANFGFPGRMGAPKLVQQQRKQGPDTPCENGSTWIIDDDGNKVRGYKGLRFCVLMDGAKYCGADDEGNPQMIREWKHRPLDTQLCKRCVECAQRLRDKWLEQWPENIDYFDVVADCEENGQPLTDEQLALFASYGHEYPSGRLPVGEIVQHVSNRIRGGKMGADSIGNAIANGWFQGLLADATKAALRRVIREMYDSSFRMPDGSMSPLFGQRFILFAHDELLCELDEDTAHESAMRISFLMVESLKRYCPDLAPACHAEPALCHYLTKSMEPRWKIGGKKPANENDRLMAWDDWVAQEKAKKAAA